MKKNLLLMLFMLMLCSSAVFAQVPSVMMYQVQIKHGKEAYQDVSVEMQLRTSQAGSAIWSQTFNLKGVKNRSVQNLGLEFGDKINWNDGEYWLATIVDGEEQGCAKIMSVPYSFVAKELEGGINASNIIGTWKCTETDSDYYITRTITFKEDGTFSCVYFYKGYHTSTITQSGTYRILANGIIYSHATSGDVDRVDACDEVARVDDNTIFMMTDDGRFGKACKYIRQ